MEAPGLISILEEEASTFVRVDNVWRPKNIFQEIQTQILLSDMVRRYKRLKAAEEELKQLPRAEVMVRNLHLMRLILKRANFVRRANHLAFAQAVSEFYSSFGEILRYLRMDQARGKITP